MNLIFIFNKFYFLNLIFIKYIKIFLNQSIKFFSGNLKKIILLYYFTNFYLKFLKRLVF